MDARLVAFALALSLLAGCDRDAAPAPAPPAALTDQQAIAAATATERMYQDALAKGDLAFLAECAPGSAESMRLVEMAADDSQGYSLAVTADARGAVAIWQGIQRLGDRRYQAYGPKGMRMDGNGWRQLQQQLLESGFIDGADAPKTSFLSGRPANSFLVSCLDGERRIARASDGPGAFDRIAVSMRRLAGNYYSPPANAPD